MMGFSEGLFFLWVLKDAYSLCAKGKIVVKDWTKLKNIKLSRGNSYRGAELQGLKFELQKTNNMSEFVFQDIRRILD